MVGAVDHMASAAARGLNDRDARRNSFTKSRDLGRRSDYGAKPGRHQKVPSPYLNAMVEDHRHGVLEDL